ncbi:MAG: hypothetical protein KGS72_25390 [Cyanobacteria bacterium REEB67]|nr:hypothetical protein [Cyanobacteria bacterium REEB67]
MAAAKKKKKSTSPAGANKSDPLAGVSVPPLTARHENTGGSAVNTVSAAGARRKTMRIWLLVLFFCGLFIASIALYFLAKEPSYEDLKYAHWYASENIRKAIESLIMCFGFVCTSVAFTLLRVLDRAKKLEQEHGVMALTRQ